MFMYVISTLGRDFHFTMFPAYLRVNGVTPWKFIGGFTLRGAAKRSGVFQAGIRKVTWTTESVLMRALAVPSLTLYARLRVCVLDKDFCLHHTRVICERWWNQWHLRNYMMRLADQAVWLIDTPVFNFYTPAQRSWRGGILDSPCPSVRLSVRLSVDDMVSGA